MIEIVYFSTADPNLTSEDIADILDWSISSNAENNITGCLIYANGEFLQIIEGKKEIVHGLFAKIKKDKRHTNVILLNENDLEKRGFSDWNMAFYDLHTEEAKSNFSKNNITQLAAIVDKPTQAKEIFWSMAGHIVS